VDWLSLVGDSVDNIPGVEGVGRKTAATLLSQFGTLANLYAHLTEVKSEKLRTALEAARDLIEKNRRLIALNDRVPGEFAIDSCAVGARDLLRLKELRQLWGIRSLVQDHENVAGAQAELFPSNSG
jgi:DNA polymerase-1